MNVPLLEYRLRNLREHGVRDIVMACGKGVREIEQHFGDGGGLGLQMRYSYEDRPLGSGRAVKEAAKFAGATGTLVVCNGDIITDIDLPAMVEQHRSTGAVLSMSLAPVDDPWEYGVVEVDDDLSIRRFVEKPPKGEEPSNLINGGTWLWEPAMLERIPDDETAIRDGFSERVLFPSLIEDGLRVQGFTEDLWVDVGSPERYAIATRLLLEHQTSPANEVLGLDGAAVARGAALEGMVALAPGAVISDGAKITGPTAIGARSLVGANVRIEASAVWEDVVVEEGAVIRGSIIGAECQIGAGAVLESAVLANGARVTPGHQLEPGARVSPGETA